MSAAPHSNHTGGASASPFGARRSSGKAWFNPANHRLDAAQRAAHQNLATALELAEAGAFVFPAKPSKEPLDGLRWQAESTTNTAKVEWWWARHPGAIPAVDCQKSGLVVLDLDRHDGGADGVAAGESLLGDLHALGAPITLTRNEGLHVFFSAPPGEKIGNSPGSLPAGIDVRSRGYVIGQGATLADGTGWTADPHAPSLAEAFAAGTIPELPAHVLDLIRTRPERPEPPRQRADDGPRTTVGDIGERERAFANAALAACTADVAGTGAGGRNVALNGAAYRMGRQIAAGRIGRAEVERALEAACEANGLARADGWASIRKTLASGIEAGMQNPAAALVDRERPDTRERRETPHFTKRDHHGGPQPGEARPTIVVDGTIIDAETGEVIEEGGGTDENAQHAGAQAQDAAPRSDGSGISVINAASFAGQPVPRQRWLIENLIPAANVGIIAGDGAVGKSLLALQLCVAVARGGEWIGFRPAAGKALYVSCEDEGQELHRRLHRLCDGRARPRRFAQTDFDLHRDPPRRRDPPSRSCRARQPFRHLRRRRD
jgi:hypothetical protein